MAKVKAKQKWFAEIIEAEYAIQVFPNEESMVKYVEWNGPCLVGPIDLDAADVRRVKKHFKNLDVATVGVRWNKYAEDFGFDPAQS